MRLSELLNRKVVTESGQQLGRVHDLRGELEGGRLRVTGLAAGKLGILERYGVGTHGSGGPGRGEGARPPRHPLGAGRPRRVGGRRPRLMPTESDTLRSKRSRGRRARTSVGRSPYGRPSLSDLLARAGR